MSINAVKSTENETDSSLMNPLNIHDTPSSSKYKYFRALINMEIDDKKNKETEENRLQDTKKHES